MCIHTVYITTCILWLRGDSAILKSTTIVLIRMPIQIHVSVKASNICQSDPCKSDMIPTTFCNIIMDLAVCSISSSELLGKITTSHCYEFFLILHIFWDNLKIQLQDSSFLQFSLSSLLQHSKKTTNSFFPLRRGGFL